MTDPSQRIQDIKSRAEKATEQYRVLRAAFDNARGEHNTELTWVRLSNWAWDNQRELVGFADSDIPFLLSALESSEAENARLRSILGHIADTAARPRPSYDEGRCLRSIADLARTALQTPEEPR